MSIEIRPVPEDRLRDFAVTIGTPLGFEFREEWLEAARTLPEWEVQLGAFDGDPIVGGAGSFSFELTTPGGSVPTAGLTMVGVLATHRRRGILRDLMRRYLDDVHAKGQPVSALWASEGAIYGRFGYGMASLFADMSLARDRATFVHGSASAATARLVDEDEAAELFPPVWDAARATTPGMLSRSPEWWRVRRLSDPEWARHGRPALQRVVLEEDGASVAYALYRFDSSWDHFVPTGAVTVSEAMSATPGGMRAVWRYLCEIDLVDRIEAIFMPVDHPLLFLLQEPRRMRMTVADGLWIRLVDVEAALSAREYGAGDPVVVDLTDDFCPWNAGRWRLAGRAERTEDEPELRLDVAALGSAYLGGFTFTQLALGGRVEELAPGALARADALFRASRAPWLPEIF